MRGLIVGLLLVVVLLLGAPLGLIGSQAGTQFLAKLARNWLGDGVSWETLDGRISGPLTIHGLRVSRPGIDLEVDQLALDWQPAALMHGELHITRLEADATRLALSPGDGDGPASTAPFDPSALRSPLDVRLSDVRFRQLTISQANAPAQRIEAVDLAATLAGDAVSLERFDLRLPEGGVAVSGDTALRSQMPLRFEAVWDWRLPAPAETVPAASGVPLRGALTVEGALDWAATIDIDLGYEVRIEGVNALAPDLPPTLSLAGRLAGEQRGATTRLERVTLALADTPLALTLEGTLDQQEGRAPAADLMLRWQGLQWPITGDEPKVRSRRGQLGFVGSPEAFELTLAADAAATGLPPGQWQLHGRGDLKTLTIEALSGQVLGGELRTRGMVAWDPTPRWELEVEGEGLDPSGLPGEVPGELALAMDSAGTFDADAGLSAEVALHDLRGTLLDRRFQASAVARLAGETVTLDSLSLASEDNAVSARGRVGPELLALDFEGVVANPGALLSGAQGRVEAEGRVTGSPQAPRLAATFQGTALALDGLQLESAEGSVDAGLDPDGPLAIALTLGPLWNGEQPVLEMASLHAQGSLASHELSLSADTASEVLALGLDGGMDALLATWSGQLSRLSLGSDAYGSWLLQAPAGLTLGAETLALEESCLDRQDGAGTVCLQARRTAVGETTLAASLRELPVAMFVPTMTGALAGEAHTTVAVDGRLNTEAIFHLSAGEVRVPMADGEELLPHGGGELRLTVDGEGLVADLDFAAPEQGRVVAEVRLPGLLALPPAEVQPLAGQAQATLPRLDSLAAWVPELAAVGGRLDANVQLAGTLGEPELAGELVLAEGRADVPTAGLALREIELGVTSDPSRPDRLDIRGGLRSGDGQLGITGEVDLAAGTLTLDLAGDRLAAYDTPDARVLLSPDLQLGWRDETLRVRGSLTIPETTITPQLRLRSAAAAEATGTVATPGQVVAPSPDVVVVNAGASEPADAPPTAAPFIIDSQLRVVLGDKVSVDALGFRSRLAGAVTFTNTPDQASVIPIASGQIEVVDGTFRAFGQDLDIETGQLIFASAPATEPELNVRAVRWIQGDPEVTAAGVLVTGPATRPVLALFSRPQLEEPSEIQSYLLTGASSRGRSNVLSVGIYLSPRFYVGYGYNLLESTSEFNSFFNITPRYGISANAGEADSNINLTVTHEN